MLFQPPTSTITARARMSRSDLFRRLLRRETPIQIGNVIGIIAGIHRDKRAPQDIPGLTADGAGLTTQSSAFLRRPTSGRFILTIIDGHSGQRALVFVDTNDVSDDVTDGTADVGEA